MKENKLIAEFMGFTSEKNIGWYDNNMMMPQSVYDSQDGNCFDDLLFDKSWDWIMPVVDKIKILVMEDDSDKLYNSEEWDNITHTLVQIEIKSVYQAVVEFIKNQNT